jgi:hypothetical protein
LNAFLGILIGSIIGVSYVALSPRKNGRGKGKRKAIKLVENEESDEALEEKAEQVNLSAYSYYPEEQMAVMSEKGSTRVS